MTARAPGARLRREPPCDVLLWTFDGTLAECLDDVEDALRRAIVGLGSVSSVVAALDLSLPALAERVASGDALQPAWRSFLGRTARYGLPSPLRVRPRSEPGPLATLVICYRS